MTAPSLATSEYRFLVYRRLGRRNRFIGLLRIGVPVFGALLLGFLVAQIIIANMAEGLSVSGVTFSRDGVVMDTPTYQGIMANGSTYKLVATRATASFANADLIELTDADLEVARPDGVSFSAFAAVAIYNLVAQTVDVPGEMVVKDSRGTNASVHSAVIDWYAQRFTATGRVDATFADGTRLRGTALVFDSGKTRWDIANPVLTTPDEPGPEGGVQ